MLTRLGVLQASTAEVSRIEHEETPDGLNKDSLENDRNNSDQGVLVTERSDGGDESKEGISVTESSDKIESSVVTDRSDKSEEGVSTEGDRVDGVDELLVDRPVSLGDELSGSDLAVELDLINSGLVCSPDSTCPYWWRHLMISPLVLHHLMFAPLVQRHRMVLPLLVCHLMLQ